MATEAELLQRIQQARGTTEPPPSAGEGRQPDTDDSPPTADDPGQPEEESPPETGAADDDAPEGGGERGGETGDGQASEDAEEVEVQSLSDLAELYGVDVADLYEIEVPLSEGKRARLGELKDAYQEARQTARMREEAAEEKRRAAEERQRIAQAAQQHEAQLNELLGAVQQQILQDYESVDWQTLRQDDPAEYAARRAEFAERQQQFEALREKAANQLAAAQRELLEQQQQEVAQLLQREQEALTRAWPEWGDPEKGEAEKARLRTYLTREGFTPEEIRTIADHRLVLLARKAMLHDESMRKVTDVRRKKVVKIGKAKVLESGARQSRQQQRSDRERQLRTKLRKTGSIHDAAALLAERRHRR